MSSKFKERLKELLGDSLYNGLLEYYQNELTEFAKAESILEAVDPSSKEEVEKDVLDANCFSVIAKFFHYIIARFLIPSDLPPSEIACGERNPHSRISNVEFGLEQKAINVPRHLQCKFGDIMYKYKDKWFLFDVKTSTNLDRCQSTSIEIANKIIENLSPQSKRVCTDCEACVFLDMKEREGVHLLAAAFHTSAPLSVIQTIKMLRGHIKCTNELPEETYNLIYTLSKSVTLLSPSYFRISQNSYESLKGQQSRIQRSVQRLQTVMTSPTYAIFSKKQGFIEHGTYYDLVEEEEANIKTNTINFVNNNMDNLKRFGIHYEPIDKQVETSRKFLEETYNFTDKDKYDDAFNEHEICNCKLRGRLQIPTPYPLTETHPNGQLLYHAITGDIMKGTLLSDDVTCDLVDLREIVLGKQLFATGEIGSSPAELGYLKQMIDTCVDQEGPNYDFDIDKYNPTKADAAILRKAGFDSSTHTNFCFGPELLEKKERHDELMRIGKLRAFEAQTMNLTELQKKVVEDGSEKTWLKNLACDYCSNCKNATESLIDGMTKKSYSKSKVFAECLRNIQTPATDVEKENIAFLNGDYASSHASFLSEHYSYLHRCIVGRSNREDRVNCYQMCGYKGLWCFLPGSTSGTDGCPYFGLQILTKEEITPAYLKLFGPCSVYELKGNMAEFVLLLFHVRKLRVQGVQQVVKLSCMAADMVSFLVHHLVSQNTDNAVNSAEKLLSSGKVTKLLYENKIQAKKPQDMDVIEETLQFYSFELIIGASCENYCGLLLGGMRAMLKTMSENKGCDLSSLMAKETKEVVNVSLATNLLISKLPRFFLNLYLAESSLIVKEPVYERDSPLSVRAGTGQATHMFFSLTSKHYQLVSCHLMQFYNLDILSARGLGAISQTFRKYMILHITNHLDFTEGLENPKLAPFLQLPLTSEGKLRCYDGKLISIEENKEEAREEIAFSVCNYLSLINEFQNENEGKDIEKEVKGLWYSYSASLVVLMGLREARKMAAALLPNSKTFGKLGLFANLATKMTTSTKVSKDGMKPAFTDISEFIQCYMAETQMHDVLELFLTVMETYDEFYYQYIYYPYSKDELAKSQRDFESYSPLTSLANELVWNAFSIYEDSSNMVMGTGDRASKVTGVVKDLIETKSNYERVLTQLRQSLGDLEKGQVHEIALLEDKLRMESVDMTKWTPKINNYKTFLYYDSIAHFLLKSNPKSLLVRLYTLIIRHAAIQALKSAWMCDFRYRKTVEIDENGSKKRRWQSAMDEDTDRLIVCFKRMSEILPRKNSIGYRTHLMDAMGHRHIQLGQLHSEVLSFTSEIINGVLHGSHLQIDMRYKTYSDDGLYIYIMIDNGQNFVEVSSSKLLQLFVCATQFHMSREKSGISSFYMEICQMIQRLMTPSIKFMSVLRTTDILSLATGSPYQALCSLIGALNNQMRRGISMIECEVRNKHTILLYNSLPLIRPSSTPTSDKHYRKAISVIYSGEQTPVLDLMRMLHLELHPLIKPNTSSLMKCILDDFGVSVDELPPGLFELSYVDPISIKINDSLAPIVNYSLRSMKGTYRQKQLCWALYNPPPEYRSSNFDSHDLNDDETSCNLFIPTVLTRHRRQNLRIKQAAIPLKLGDAVEENVKQLSACRSFCDVKSRYSEAFQLSIDAGLNAKERTYFPNELLNRIAHLNRTASTKRNSGSQEKWMAIYLEMIHKYSHLQLLLEMMRECKRVHLLETKLSLEEKAVHPELEIAMVSIHVFLYEFLLHARNAPPEEEIDEVLLSIVDRRTRGGLSELINAQPGKLKRKNQDGLECIRTVTSVMAGVRGTVKTFNPPEIVLQACYAPLAETGWNVPYPGRLETDINYMKATYGSTFEDVIRNGLTLQLIYKLEDLSRTLTVVNIPTNQDIEKSLKSFTGTFKQFHLHLNCSPRLSYCPSLKTKSDHESQRIRKDIVDECFASKLFLQDTNLPFTMYKCYLTMYSIMITALAIDFKCELNPEVCSVGGFTLTELCADSNLLNLKSNPKLKAAFELVLPPFCRKYNITLSKKYIEEIDAYEKLTQYQSASSKGRPTIALKVGVETFNVFDGKINLQYTDDHGVLYHFSSTVSSYQGAVLKGSYSIYVNTFKSFTLSGVMEALRYFNVINSDENGLLCPDTMRAIIPLRETIHEHIEAQSHYIIQAKGEKIVKNISHCVHQLSDTKVGVRQVTILSERLLSLGKLEKELTSQNGKLVWTFDQKEALLPDQFVKNCEKANVDGECMQKCLQDLKVIVQNTIGKDLAKGKQRFLLGKGGVSLTALEDYHVNEQRFIYILPWLKYSSSVKFSLLYGADDLRLQTSDMTVAVEGRMLKIPYVKFEQKYKEEVRDCPELLRALADLHYDQRIKNFDWESIQPLLMAESEDMANFLGFLDDVPSWTPYSKHIIRTSSEVGYKGSVWNYIHSMSVMRKKQEVSPMSFLSRYVSLLFELRVEKSHLDNNFIEAQDLITPQFVEKVSKFFQYYAGIVKIMSKIINYMLPRQLGLKLQGYIADGGINKVAIILHDLITGGLWCIKSKQELISHINADEGQVILTLPEGTSYNFLYFEEKSEAFPIHNNRKGNTVNLSQIREWKEFFPELFEEMLPKRHNQAFVQEMKRKIAQRKGSVCSLTKAYKKALTILDCREMDVSTALARFEMLVKKAVDKVEQAPLQYKEEYWLDILKEKEESTTRVSLLFATEDLTKEQRNLESTIATESGSKRTRTSSGSTAMDSCESDNDLPDLKGLKKIQLNVKKLLKEGNVADIISLLNKDSEGSDDDTI